MVMDNRESIFTLLKDMGVQKDEPMRLHTSFKIGGPAYAFVEPQSPEQLALAVSAAEAVGLAYIFIGNGTDLLVSDDGITALVIRVGERMSGLYREGRTYTALAGTPLSALAKAAVAEGFGGLEWAAGIPGTVGGAIAMNAGAYGGEIKQVLKRVAYFENGRTCRAVPQEGELGYRKSAFAAPERITLSAEFELYEDAAAAERMREYTRQRQEKQPLKYPSAGSVFKRPEGNFAGTLIEKAGLKGYTVGGAQVSSLHAGFIINTGGASCRDVLQLIQHIQQTVLEKSGVLLQPEIKIIGDF